MKGEEDAYVNETVVEVHAEQCCCDGRIVYETLLHHRLNDGFSIGAGGVVEPHLETSRFYGGSGEDEEEQKRTHFFRAGFMYWASGVGDQARDGCC